ncbi:MAG: hypothetical protein MMC23_003894 [Stictis urceolatum]|nr:hypothetical protein [Stictis urceolata]
MAIDLEDLSPAASDTTDVEEQVEPEERTGLRRILRHFHLVWFAATMGTGVIAINLYTIPYPTQWLRPLSIVFFIGNIGLFVVLAIVLLLKLLLERSWRSLVDVHGQGLYLGTIPMGFSTLISMFTYVCVPHWGSRAMEAAWALWIADEIVSTAVTLGILTGLAFNPPLPLRTLTPAYILPFIPPIVSAGTGATVLSALPLPAHTARATASLSICYLSLGIGLSFSLLILTFYLCRLLLHGFPSAPQRASVLIPLGPLGQSAGALIVLGRAAVKIGHSIDAMIRSGKGTGISGIRTQGFTEQMGWGLQASGTMVALFLWGMGLVWLILAGAAVGFGKGRMYFSASWWGFIFPMGVFTFAALQFGTVLGDGSIGRGSGIWGVVGTVFTVWLVGSWVLVVAGVMRSMIRSMRNRVEKPR